MTERYSHSKLEAFKVCPKKYHFSYVERPEIPYEEGVEAFMGSRTHEALEWLYQQRMMEREPTLQEVLATYETAWDREWHDGVRVVREEYGPDDYRAVGRKALERYFARYSPFDSAITIATECSVQFELDPEGEYVLRGVIDRIDKVADGVYEIHDYKTSGRLPEQAKMDADRQLALYQIAVQEMWPDAREVSLVWHYLKFDAEIRSARTPDELEELRASVLELIEEVECCTEFEPRPSALCDWCEFAQICPARKHLFDVRQLPLELLPKEEGVSLVARYVELEDQVKRLQDEKEDVRDAIVAYGDTHDVSTLFGQGHAVRIWRKQSRSFPDKDHPKRAELEQWLKDNGLFEKAAYISSYGLSKLLEDKTVDPDLRKALADFGEPDEIVRLYPRKNR